MYALLELGHVFPDIGSTNARMTFDVHVVAEGDDDLLDLLCELTRRSENERLGALDRKVELLQDRDGKSRCFAGTRLGLGDNVVAFDDGHDGALLNGGGAFETGKWVGER